MVEGMGVWLGEVTFSDITMGNSVNHPRVVRLAARKRAPRGAGVATVQRVRFDTINVSGANGRYACGVVGIADGIIRDVTFSDVHVSSAGGGTAADAALEPDRKRVVVGKSVSVRVCFRGGRRSNKKKY